MARTNTKPKVWADTKFDSCSLPLLRWAKCVIEEPSFRKQVIDSGLYHSIEIKGDNLLIDPVNGMPKIVYTGSSSICEGVYEPSNSGTARMRARILIGLEFNRG